MIERPTDHSSKLARGELADPEAAERLEAEHPEAFMRRRDFLARTAALAGAASLATVLPADTLVAEAARHGLRPLPSPRNMPINTVVVLMMENRSFDHYFGWFPNADGKNAGPLLSGRERPPGRHPPPDLGLPGLRLPRPRPLLGRGALPVRQGQMDGFVKGNASGTGSDAYAAGYYLKQRPAVHPLRGRAPTRSMTAGSARSWTPPTPTATTSGGPRTAARGATSLPLRRTGYTWETIFDRAIARGLTARYYYSDLPFAALYGKRGTRLDAPGARSSTTDAAAGKLPNIAFVDPAFVGEDQGTSGDEHPHGDIRVGQAFMSDVVHAFMESPQYRRGRPVHRLRRVGRLLRARQAAPRP